MITLKHLDIYKKYEGDADGFSRCATSEEKSIVQDGDWLIMESLIQDLVIIKKGLASKTFEQTIRNTLNNDCLNSNVIEELNKIANNI